MDNSPEWESLAQCRWVMRHLVLVNFYQTSLPGPFLLSSIKVVLMTLTEGVYLPNLKYFNFHLDIKV